MNQGGEQFLCASQKCADLVKSEAAITIHIIDIQYFNLLTFFLSISFPIDILDKYTVLEGGFMVGEQFYHTQHKWACVQFIAEVSLIANCKSADLKIALSIIADLASRENDKQEDDIFYEVQ